MQKEAQTIGFKTGQQARERPVPGKRWDQPESNGPSGRCPSLRLIRERFAREKPLAGAPDFRPVSTSLPRLPTWPWPYKAGGADLALCASNPLSTQDEVAAALVSEYDIATFSIKGEDNETYYRHINSALEHQPQITMDDGADLVTILHRQRSELLDKVSWGAPRRLPPGLSALKQWPRRTRLRYPIVAVNEADTKHFFDNRYGTGQSTLDGITRATNILWAGRRVVVAGYGWCGRGIASRARGLGRPRHSYRDLTPVRALEAIMDGFHRYVGAGGSP